MRTNDRVSIRRVYDAPADNEGVRVLVDRLWPRGRSHEEVGEDIWAKDAAPSSELRRWFHAHPDHLEEFEKRYRAELASSGAAEALAEQLRGAAHITLLYAAKDPKIAHANVLANVLEGKP